ncbi:hypothetical protein LJR044_002346 [Microbacterium foliorum]
MTSPVPKSATPWHAFDVVEVTGLLTGSPVLWWLSGGVALDRWVGAAIRPRPNIDVSVTAADLASFVGALPAGFSAWASSDDEGHVVPFEAVAADSDPQPVLVRDEVRGAWVMQVNVEDGTSAAWVYKRDPRLTLPWDRAVLDIDGIPTGAPEVQLVWKALRPRPEDTVDMTTVRPTLSDEAVAFFETALLRIHPHSTWSIHVRSPFTPAKASWNRPKRS